VNPLLLPGTAWTIRTELAARDAIETPAELLYRAYGPKCEVSATLYAGLFAERPTEWISKVLLRSVRWRYLTSLASLGEADSQLAHVIARDLIQLLDGDEIAFVSMLPLGGLRVPERLEVDNAVLRPIAPDEYLALREDEPFLLEENVLRFARRFEFHDERAVLEVRERRPKLARDDGDVSGIRSVVLALQLLGFDPKGEGQAVTFTEPFRFGGLRGSPVVLATRGQRRDIARADLAATVELARRIPKGVFHSPRAQAEVALARFQTAVVERSHADAVVDYVIALEAMLLPGVRDELRYRFGLCGAWFLGADRADRLRLADEFRDLYDARSAIVHGTPPAAHRLEPLGASARRLCALTLTKALREGFPTAQALADAPFG
jgi:hypothetical protein